MAEPHSVTDGKPPADSALPQLLLDDLGRLCKLLADDTRLRIVYFLTRQPELHVRALCELLGESQPAVSHHLALLRNAKLIDRRRQGKHNYYALKSERITQLLDLIFATLPESNRRIRLEDYLLTYSPA